MARTAGVKKNFPAAKPALLAPFMTNVATSMDGNANFPDAPVDSKTMNEAAGIVLMAYSNRKNGVMAKEALKTAVTNGLDLLTTQAAYVNTVAGGNVEVITSSGFSATKTSKTKAVTPQTPKPPVLENVNGELSMKISTVKGAASYCWLVFVGAPSSVSITNSQLNFNMQSNVIVVPAGSTRECVRGLSRGTEVTVQVLAQNTAGKSALSAGVSIGIA